MSSRLTLGRRREPPLWPIEGGLEVFAVIRDTVLVDEVLGVSTGTAEYVIGGFDGGTSGTGSLLAGGCTVGTGSLLARGLGTVGTGDGGFGCSDLA